MWFDVRLNSIWFSILEEMFVVSLAGLVVGVIGTTFQLRPLYNGENETRTNQQEERFTTNETSECVHVRSHSNSSELGGLALLARLWPQIEK